MRVFCNRSLHDALPISLETVTLTEACGAMLANEQLSKLPPVMEQEPAARGATVAVLPESQPPLDRVSCNFTLVADALPAIAGLLTTILMLVCPPMVRVP